MSKKEPTEEEMETRVRRTKKLMKAGSTLRDYRDRIDDILQALNSNSGFASELADDCISMGLGLQEVASTLRRLSVEGDWQAKMRKAKWEWSKTKAKMSKLLEQEEYVAWLEMHSVKVPKSSHKKRVDEYTYYGPNEHFVATLLEDEGDNT